MPEPRIQDHAIVGDGRSVALVACDGSIDWLCWPRFDSPSVFAALLDPAEGGRFRVSPAEAAVVRRAYVDDTNVLETTFECSSGTVRLTDVMAIQGPEAARRRLAPEHELLRIATCERGAAAIDVEADLRPRYARHRGVLRRAGRLGLRLEDGRELYTLRATAPLELGADGIARARVPLRAGDSVQLSLAYDAEGPAALPPLGVRVTDAVRDTAELWRSWVATQICYDGPHRAAVVRSALALKLLFFAPSGALVAAPTTSLPERVGADLNWDYRFCWLRDAALTVNALHGISCGPEAEAFTSWLLHATRLTRPELRVLYDVYGRLPRDERVLGHLAGHRGSRPVRVGNAAADQRQLDVYGEVIDAVAQGVRRGRALDRETQDMLVDFGGYVCRTWLTPDDGIWEPREAPRLRTHSLVLGYTALSRLLELHRRGALTEVPVTHFEANRAAMREAVETRGFHAGLGSYVADLDGATVDAALLLLGWYGFAEHRSPRMQGTWRRIRERLGAGPGLLYRYEPSREAGEGAFGICSFWAAEFLARGGGTLAEAAAWLDALVARANDVGLYAEEIDPSTGEALGNFPQAFTHVGLLSAALAVAQRARDERAVAPDGAARAAEGSR